MSDNFIELTYYEYGAHNDEDFQKIVVNLSSIEWFYKVYFFKENDVKIKISSIKEPVFLKDYTYESFIEHLNAIK